MAQPNWQPVSVPDLCPRCGAYWECEHNEVTQEPPRDVELTTEIIQAARERLFSGPVPAFFEEIKEALFENIPDTFDFNKLDSLGLARADGLVPSKEWVREHLLDVDDA